jgi:hypothetical protein
VRVIQVHRDFPTGIREQLGTLSEDDWDGHEFHFIDEILFEQLVDQPTAAGYLKFTDPASSAPTPLGTFIHTTNGPDRIGHDRLSRRRIAQVSSDSGCL